MESAGPNDSERSRNFEQTNAPQRATTACKGINFIKQSSVSTKRKPMSTLPFATHHWPLATSRSVRFRFVRLGQADPRVGGGEMLGQVLAIGRGEASNAFPFVAQPIQHVARESVEVAQVNDGFAQPFA